MLYFEYIYHLRSHEDKIIEKYPQTLYIFLFHGNLIKVYQNI